MSRLPSPITIERPHPDRRRRKRRSEAATAWTFAAPSAVIILGLGVVPVVWSLLLSFQANNLVTPSHWTGLDNYRALAEDPRFSEAVRNTLLYVVLYVPLSMVAGLMLAHALNRRIRKLERRDRLSWLYIRSLINHAYVHNALPLPDPPDGWLEETE